MIAVDTHVVVRFITSDDPVQSRRAVSLFHRNRVFIGVCVLVETDWVLRTKFGLTRPMVAEAITRLCGIPSVVVEQPALVERALDAHRHGLAFADAIHLITAEMNQATEFATFDNDLRKRGKQVVRSVSAIAP